MSEQKIDRTFTRVMDEIDRLQKAFKKGGKFEQAVAELGGDIAWFNDINEAFDKLYDTLEEGHMGAVIHLQNEDVTESKQINEGVLDADDDDGFMARSQLYFMARDAITLHGMINDTDDLEPWVQSKISQAAQSIDAVRRYTEYNAVEAEVEQPAVEPSMESFSDQVREFGMFSKGGNAQVQNAIQYILNDFDDATENATNSERDMLRMEAHRKLMKELEDLSDSGYDEAMDTDVRERAAEYLESGIIRILDRLDDLNEGKYKNDAQRKAVHAAKAEKANESTDETLEEGMEFDDNRKGELKTVAQDMFKNALSKAKKKAKK